MSTLLASSVAWRSQLFSASPLCDLVISPLCDLVMNPPAVSTTFRHHSSRFFAALGHNTVSTVNSKGELFVDPSVAFNTLMLSARHWTRFVSGRPRPGFSPPANVPNITRSVSRSLVVCCTPPAKSRRRLRKVVSTLSHYAFLRALSYDMRWSMRCRRRKPMTRRRRLWHPVQSSRTCSWSGV